MGIDKKIKVCHLISGDLWAGAESQAYAMITSLTQLPEFAISAIVLNQGRLESSLCEAGIPVLVIDESKYGFWSLFDQASKCLRQNRVDIIHSHRYKENLLAFLLRQRGLASSLVQTVHGLPEATGGLGRAKASVYSCVNSFMSRRHFDKVICVSYDIERFLRNQNRFRNTVAIHNAIECSSPATPNVSTYLKSQLGLADDVQLVGAIGRAVPVKGFDTFLRLAAQVQRLRNNVRFVLVGDGPCLESLRALAQERGSSDSLYFLGFRDDVTEILRSLDLMVMTSLHEGIPMILLEAMAEQRAVLAYSVGGIPEVIETDKSGILVDGGNESVLLETCLRLLESRDLRVRLGIAARQRVEREFSTSAQRLRLASVYRETLLNR